MADGIRAVHAASDRAAAQGRRTGRLFAFVRSGAVAGIVSAVAFTAIHEVLISNIRFMLGPMVVAGALCGACVAWSYALLVPRPTTGSWIRYNATYLALFVGLAVTSIAVLEPIMTAAEAMALGDGPGELIARSMPLNLAAVIVGTALVTRLFRGGRRELGPVLLTVGLLVLFLGHNVSPIGLVEFESGDLYLLGELAGLIVAINAVFVVAFLTLERPRLHTGPRARPSSGPNDPTNRSDPHEQTA
jgi:hypothetical protein